MSTSRPRTRTPVTEVEHTTASPEFLWACWTDVRNWSDWDPWVESAALEGSFKVGASGRVVEKSGYHTTFTVIAADAPRYLEFAVHLPGVQVHMSREIVEESAKTTFKHSIWLNGWLWWLWIHPLRRRRADMGEATKNIATYAGAFHR